MKDELVLKILREIAEPHSGAIFSRREAASSAVALIEQQAARIADLESASKDAIRREVWISVDERLPEEDSVVLVSAWEYGKPDGKRFTLVARRVGSLFLNEETGDDLYTPTHWMPLPEAPAALSQKVGDQQ